MVADLSYKLQIATEETRALKEENRKVKDQLKQYMERSSSLVHDISLTNLEESFTNSSRTSTKDAPSLKKSTSASNSTSTLMNESPFSNELKAAESNRTDTHNEAINCKKLNRSLFMIGDSHCRNLINILKMYNAPHSKTTCIYKSGRTLNYIVNQIKPSKLSPNTQICVMAGTNDIFKTNFADIKSSIDTLSEKCKMFKVLFVLIPPRYDNPKLNFYIVKLNVKMKHYFSKYQNFTFIDPNNFLQISHYSSDGVHMNLKGKNILCYRIINKAFEKVYNNKVKIDKKLHNSNMTRSVQHKLPITTFNHETSTNTETPFMRHAKAQSHTQNHWRHDRGLPPIHTPISRSNMVYRVRQNIKNGRQSFNETSSQIFCCPRNFPPSGNPLCTLMTPTQHIHSHSQCFPSYRDVVKMSKWNPARPVQDFRMTRTTLV